MSLGQIEKQLGELNLAPLAHEQRVREQARSILTELSAYPAGAQVWRLRAQAQALLDWGGSLECVRHALQWASAQQDQPELAKTLEFLQQLNRSQPEDPPGLKTGEPFQQAVLRLAACQSVLELQQQTVEWALRLSGLPELAWIAPQPSGWEARCWQPLSSWPRYSEHILDRCRSSRNTLFGEARQLEDSRSVALSDLKHLLVVPVQWQHQFYAVLYSQFQSSEAPAHSLASLEFLGSIAGAVAQRIEKNEQARFSMQQAKTLREVRQQALAGTPFGLAWADAGGQLLECNPAFAALWDQSPQPGTPLWAMFIGDEQQRDRLALEQLKKMRNRLVVQRSRGGRRWLQVSDWRDGERIIRCVLDLTDQEPARWLSFLEEIRHELAVDIHDGPSQNLAVWRLEEDSPDSAEADLTIKARLSALRSPWLEQKSPRDHLVRWLRLKFLELEPQLQWDDRLSLELQQQSFRLVQAWAEELKAGWRLNHLKILVGRQRSLLSWRGQPFQSGQFSQLLLDWTAMRARLSEGQLQGPLYRATGGEIQVNWSGG